jgi:type I restriction enzyme, S subunit
MSEWKEYRFSDFINLNPSVKIPKGIKVSFVEMKDLENGKRFCEPSQKRDLSGGSRFENNDTLFARITPCLENGKICQVRNLDDGIGFGSTEFHVFREKQNISNSDFIYYLSRCPDVRDHAEINLDGTSGRQRVPRQAFDDLILNLPHLPEQKAIASILSSLDDKIDLLHRQNTTLEKMAETLFRQWFVEEAKEEWEEKPLSDYITIKHGYAFKGDLITAELTPLKLVTPGNFNIGGGFKHGRFKYYTSDNFPESYIFKPDDLVVTMTDLSVDGDTLGYSALVPESFGNEKYLHNQRVGKVEFKTDIGKFFIYHLMKTEDYQWYILSGASGTSIRHTSPTSIGSYKFKLPPKEKMMEFENYFKDMHEKIKRNQIQIRTLTSMRDNLLPKLMSGEVRVKL